MTQRSGDANTAMLEAEISSGPRVDFLICGTQKGGTTALHSYLRQHPQIGLASVKEAHYFDTEDNFRDGAPDYAAYHRLFDFTTTHAVRGEATPIYMYWQDAPRRIWEYNPRMKIIVILRNPVRRAFSHWNMWRSEGRETLPFWDALHQERARSRRARPLQDRLYSYVDRGYYCEQLRRIWRFFPEEQTLILRSEDLRMRPTPTLDRVFGFLGIRSLRGIAARAPHSRGYPVPMTQREHDYLRTVFEPEIRALERMLGWDCSGWLAEPLPGRLTSVGPAGE